MEEWDDLLLLTGPVNYAHLFVVVSSRKGSISYQTSFEPVSYTHLDVYQRQLLMRLSFVAPTVVFWSIRPSATLYLNGYQKL